MRAVYKLHQIHLVHRVRLLAYKTINTNAVQDYYINTVQDHCVFFSVCVTACSTHNCHWVGQEKAMVGRMWLYDLVRLVRLVRYQT